MAERTLPPEELRQVIQQYLQGNTINQLALNKGLSSEALTSQIKIDTMSRENVRYFS